MKLSKMLAAGVAAAAVASFAAVSASAYTGYIGFQTTAYSFRNSQDETNYGKGTDYFNGFIVWGNNDPETFPDYEDNFDYDIAGYVLPATYTDVNLVEDGTYTVTAKDIDWALDGTSDFNLIFVSTDIPMDAGVTCTNAKIIVDGAVVSDIDSPICDESQKFFNIGLANVWNPDIGNYGGAFPSESLAIEFTIEGLGAPAAAEAPAVEETPAAADSAVDAAAAPAAGDTSAPSTAPSKGSPDTGVADVAVIGGLALVAGAAIVVTRKRK